MSSNHSVLASSPAQNPNSTLGNHALASPSRQSNEQQGWERELFFNPRLLDQERRASTLMSGGKRPLAILLAMVLGLCASGLALADVGQGAPAGSNSSTSSEGVLDWWLELVGLNDEEDAATTQSKSGATDPDEGED